MTGQPAQTYQVTPTGWIRLGSNRVGARIINQSLSATVWLSPQPGVPGTGTPVVPGTPVQWTRDGDLYASLGTDPDSVAAGSATIVLSSDISDSAANPVAVASATAIALLNSGVGISYRYDLLSTGPGVTPWLDVRKYTSLVIFPNVALPNTASTLVNFDVAGALDASGTGSTLLNGWYGYRGSKTIDWTVQYTVPCMFPYMRITGPPSGYSSIIVYGTNRPNVASPSGYNDHERNSPYLENGQLVAANSGIFIYLPAVKAKLHATVMLIGGANVLDTKVQLYTIGSLLYEAAPPNVWVAAGNGVNADFQALLTSQQPTRLFLYNNTATPKNIIYRLSLEDVG